MDKPFSPSVNIVRDAAQPLAYLPTRNAQLVYHFYSLLTSRYNPDFAKWAIIRDSLD